MAAFTVIALMLFLPSTPFSGILPSVWVQKVPKIVLGLDLQGGMHLVLDVDRDKAVNTYTTRVKGAVEEHLRKKSIPYRSVSMVGDSGVSVGSFDAKTLARIKAAVAAEFPYTYRDRRYG